MRHQTICVNSTPGDARRAAEEVATNLRAAGNTVDIGEEYTMGLSHKAGMLAVDLTIEETASAGGQVAPVAVAAPAEPVSTDKYDISDNVIVNTKPDPAVVMATADGFDKPDQTLAEEYPRLTTPPSKNKGGRPKKKPYEIDTEAIV